MRNKLILIVALCVSFSCGLFLPRELKLPGWPRASQDYIEERISTYDTSLALSLIYLEWERQFGDPDLIVYEAFSQHFIEWMPEPIPVPYYGEGKVATGGLTPERHHSQVVTRENCLIYCTGLSHELVHAALWALNDEPDPDHEIDTGKYHGWTEEHNLWIEETDAKLQLLEELGLIR